jgi:hypothetical protein
MVEVDPQTDAQVVDRIDRLFTASRGPAPEAERLERRQTIAKGAERLRAEDPARYAALRERVRSYDARLTRFGLRDDLLDAGPTPATVVRFAVRETLLAAPLGFLSLAGLALFAAPYFTLSWISRARRPVMEVEATEKVIIGIAVYGAWMPILGAVAGAVAGWRIGVLVTLLLPVVAVGALLALERESAVIDATLSYMARRRAPARARRRLRDHRDDLADLIEGAAGRSGAD